MIYNVLMGTLNPHSLTPFFARLRDRHINAAIQSGTPASFVSNPIGNIHHHRRRRRHHQQAP